MSKNFTANALIYAAIKVGHAASLDEIQAVLSDRSVEQWQLDNLVRNGEFATSGGLYYPTWTGLMGAIATTGGTGSITIPAWEAGKPNWVR